MYGHGQDCCGDMSCDRSVLNLDGSTPCVIHIHQINCLPQEEFDKVCMQYYT